MEPGGSMLHSQELSNNPYPELNEPFSLCFSLNVRDHASHPHSTAGNIIVV